MYIGNVIVPNLRYPITSSPRAFWVTLNLILVDGVKSKTRRDVRIYIYIYITFHYTIIIKLIETLLSFEEPS